MKIGNLYNLESVKNLTQTNVKIFTDANFGAMLQRNLIAIDPTIYEAKYPQLALLNCGITIDNTGGTANYIDSLRTQSVGDFAQANIGANNGGVITFSGSRSQIANIPYFASSSWTIDDIRNYEIQGINVVSHYIQDHNKLYLNKIDEVGMNGTDSLGGLLNYPFATSVVATLNGATGAVMYDTIANLIVNQQTVVNSVSEYKANVVLMPERILLLLSATRLTNTDTTSRTVLMALKDNFPDVLFLSTHRSLNKVVAFSNNMNAMKLRIPQPLEIGQIFQTGSFSAKFDSKFRVAGIDIFEATAGRTITGV